jgi:hypothetical protein
MFADETAQPPGAGGPSADPPVPAVLLVSTVAAAVRVAQGQSLPPRIARLVSRLTEPWLRSRQGRRQAPEWQGQQRRVLEWRTPPGEHGPW